MLKNCQLLKLESNNKNKTTKCEPGLGIYSSIEKLTYSKTIIYAENARSEAKTKEKLLSNKKPACQASLVIFLCKKFHFFFTHWVEKCLERGEKTSSSMIFSVCLDDVQISSLTKDRKVVECSFLC